MACQDPVLTVLHVPESGPDCLAYAADCLTCFAAAGVDHDLDLGRPHVVPLLLS